MAKATAKIKMTAEMKAIAEQSLMKIAGTEEATVRIRTQLGDLLKGDFEGVSNQEDLEALIAHMALNATALGAVGAAALSHLGYAETLIDGTVKYESILDAAEDEDGESDEDDGESDEDEDSDEDDDSESDEDEDEDEDSDEEDDSESEDEDASEDEDEDSGEDEDASEDEDEEDAKPVRRGAKTTAAAKKPAASAKAKASESELTDKQQKLYDANLAGLLTLLGDSTDADAMMKKIHNRMKAHGMDAAKFGKPQGRPGAKGYADKAARHATLAGKNISKRVA